MGERMFWRYESGTGAIRENDAVEMVSFILERHAKAPCVWSDSVRSLSDLIVGKRIGEGTQSSVRLARAIARASEAGIKVEEQWLSKVVQQVFAGVAFLHSRHVIHCDLKETNVMVANAYDWASPEVVVTDFGLADMFSNGQTFCGTPGYVPPEVWTDSLWTPRGDVFSLGVMMFKVRTGVDPFLENCQSLDEVKEKTLTLNPEFKLANGRPRMSKSMVALVSRMLDKEFKKRPGIMSLVDDPWFEIFSCHPITESVNNTDTPRQVREEARLYRALLSDMAARDSIVQLRSFNDLLVELDFDKNGGISADDVRKVLGPSWEAEDVDRLIDGLSGRKKETCEEVRCSCTGKMGCAGQRFCNEDSLGNANIVSVGPFGDVTDVDACSDGNTSFNDTKSAMDVVTWKVGDDAEYLSSTFDKWIPCKILEVESTASVQVDVKVGHWLTESELSTRLRQSTRRKKTSRTKSSQTPSTLSRKWWVCCGKL